MKGGNTVAQQTQKRYSISLERKKWFNTKIPTWDYQFKTSHRSSKSTNKWVLLIGI